MIRSGLVSYYQFQENCQKKGLLATIRKSLYQCDETVPVEKDLLSLRTQEDVLEQPIIDILELDESNYFNITYKYPLKSRQERALHYLKNGYKTFIVVQGKEIVAEVWYVTKKDSRLKYIYPKVKWSDIKMGDTDVYLFDLFVKPDSRASFPTTKFLSNVLKLLSKRGFTTAYGDYVSDNTPALWVHRMLGYQEHSSFSVKRYFLVQFVKKHDTNRKH